MSEEYDFRPFDIIADVLSDTFEAGKVIANLKANGLYIVRNEPIVALLKEAAQYDVLPIDDKEI